MKSIFKRFKKKETLSLDIQNQQNVDEKIPKSPINKKGNILINFFSICMCKICFKNIDDIEMDILSTPKYNKKTVDSSAEYKFPYQNQEKTQLKLAEKENEKRDLIIEIKNITEFDEICQDHHHSVIVILWTAEWVPEYISQIDTSVIINSFPSICLLNMDVKIMRNLAYRFNISTFPLAIALKDNKEIYRHEVYSTENLFEVMKICISLDNDKINVIQNDQPHTFLQSQSERNIVIVLFEVTWSHSCYNIVPIVIPYLLHYHNIQLHRVDVDQYYSLALSFNIIDYPTVIVYHHGEIKWRFEKPSERDIAFLFNCIILEMEHTPHDYGDEEKKTGIFNFNLKNPLSS